MRLKKQMRFIDKALSLVLALVDAVDHLRDLLTERQPLHVVILGILVGMIVAYQQASMTHQSIRCSLHKEKCTIQTG
jgi:hypothetical protein